MKNPQDTAARVLIAAEGASDAELVRNVLRERHPLTDVSTQPDEWAADFDRVRPLILVLAFKTLEAAERCYLGLYRRSAVVNAHPHRTIVLCTKEEGPRAFEMCRQEYFDDYVQFWPMALDGLRLPMAVHLALRALGTGQAASAVARLTAQARRITELELQVEKLLASARSAETAVGGVRSASHGAGQAETDAHDAPAPAQPPQWLGALRDNLPAPAKAPPVPTAPSSADKPLVLIVDDDDFICKQISHVLLASGYDVETAVDGASALVQLRRRRPQVVLMDFNLPDTDGIEVTRQMKGADNYATIPVIMLTGHSEKHVIVDSLRAGAAGFLVKPVDREALLKKVAEAMRA